MNIEQKGFGGGNCCRMYIQCWPTYLCPIGLVQFKPSRHPHNQSATFNHHNSLAPFLRTRVYFGGLTAVSDCLTLSEYCFNVLWLCKVPAQISVPTIDDVIVT